MSDLILIILGAVLIPTLLTALALFIYYKLWPCAKSDKCRIEREDDAFAIYDSFFTKELNPIGHIYIKNNKAEVHIRKTFEEDEIIDFEPIESWIATDEVFKGCMVGVPGADKSAGKLSIELIRNRVLAFFSQRNSKATIEKLNVSKAEVAPDETNSDETELEKTEKENESKAKVERKVFKIKEYGSLKKEVEKILPMRKLLCGYLAIQDDIHRRLDTTVADGGHSRQKPKWKETVYLALLIFSAIYLPVILCFSYENLLTPYIWASPIIFFLIWFILYEIHFELTFKNTRFTQFLRLLNRCTGMKNLQRVFYLFSVIGMVLSLLYYKYIEYFVVLHFVMKYGRFNYNLWKVDDPLVPMITEDELVHNRVDDGAEDPNPNPALFDINSYHWSISGLDTNNKMVLHLKFDKASMARLTNNYDNIEFLNSDGDPADAAKYYVEQEKDSLHIKKICWFVDSITSNRGLSRMQRMQSILDFVQDGESFERIEESGVSSRLRSAEEILYNQKATAMDRAILASMIYVAMDYKVNILQSRDGRVALEVAEKENVCKDLCAAIRNDVFSYNDNVYYVCDMQADNFVIGTIPSFKKSDFVRRIVIA